MIYTLVFNLSGVYGPIGYAHHSRSEVLHFGRSLAKTALDHLGDYVNEAEWFTATGETSDDPYHLLDSADENEVACAINQVHDLLISKDEGSLSMQEFKYLHEVLEYHDVLSWCSPSLRAKIEALHAAQESLFSDFAEEWSRE